MRSLFIVLLSCLFLTSCGTYRISTTPKVKISKILTITSTGDTLAVPMRDFQRYNFNTYDFNRFNFNNSLYWNGWQHPYFGWGYGWNNWNSPFQPYYHDWWYRPIPNSTFIRPQIQSPNRRQRVQINGRRGSNTNQRQPDDIDKVIRKLNGRGINVDIIENNVVPNRNWNNRIVPRENNNIVVPRNNSSTPRMRPSPPPPSNPPVISRGSNNTGRSAGRRNQQ